MTELSPSELENLRSAFKEIAFRANRLREWADMEPRLLALESSFGEFFKEAEDAPNQMSAAKTRRMNGKWRRCQETELLDLQTFVESLRDINRVSAAAGNGSQATVSSGLPRADISSIAQLIEPVELALKEKAWDLLAERSSLFNRSVKAKIANHRQIVKRELMDLCELTIRLSVALGPPV